MEIINLKNNLEFVESSLIKGFAYSVEEHVLLIRFNGDKDFLYRGMTPQEFESFQHATSYGEHFNDYIKNEYPYEKREQQPERELSL